MAIADNLSAPTGLALMCYFLPIGRVNINLLPPLPRSSAMRPQSDLFY